MISHQIENQEIEQTLLSQFQSPEKIRQYLYELVVENLEDKRLSNLIKENHKKEFVLKKRCF